MTIVDGPGASRPRRRGAAHGGPPGVTIGMRDIYDLILAQGAQLSQLASKVDTMHADSISRGREMERLATETGRTADRVTVLEGRVAEHEQMRDQVKELQERRWPLPSLGAVLTGLGLVAAIVLGIINLA